jgi:hypothetical protein
MTRISAKNQIVAFFHCRKCLNELPKGMSPSDWASHEIGYTKIGIQVWCKRHECNIVHTDFEGIKHPGNFDAYDSFSEGEES